MNVYYFHHQADELLGTASEQFLGKTVKEIKQTILQTLEGHLRAILGKSMHYAILEMNDEIRMQYDVRRASKFHWVTLSIHIRVCVNEGQKPIRLYDFGTTNINSL